MTKKRKIIYITIAAAIVIIAALAIIFMPKAAPQTVTEMLSTAQKYLVEMDYERAIAEFNKVIELDPMNADAYLGLAEAYEKSGDIDKAVETLEKGFELTGDERLQARIAMLTSNGGVTVPNVSETEEFITIKGEQYSTSLTNLDLSNKNLNDEDIKELNKMTNLTDLSLWGNQISDVSVLSGLTSLTQLNLYKNQISDISELSGLTNLTILYLGNNQLSDISALSGLINLAYLDLNENQISDISVLSGLTNLTDLHLAENQISDVSAFLKHTQLEKLSLYENQINDISVLSGLTNLTDLSLEENQISESDIESLKSALSNCEINY